MDSDFIGKTIILVNKPYQIWEHGFFSHNLDNLISGINFMASINEYFYDDSSSKKGYSGHQFAINALESIDEAVIKKWADYSEMYKDMMEDYLLKLANPFNTDGLNDLFYKIPINQSPIISLSSESLANIHYGESDGANSFRFPDEGKGLFTEMAKVEIFNHASLRRFSNVFGLPTGIDISRKSGLKALDGLKDYNTFLYFGASPITLIDMELMEYKNVFNSFIAVKTGNAKLAKKINARKDFVNEARKISEVEKERVRLIERLRIEYMEALGEIEVGMTFDEKAELMRCRKDLANKLTKKVAFNTKIVDTLDGRFLETKIYSNLFEIAYNQIKNSLINNAEIKECEYCGHYFEPEHGTQRFCSPLPFRKRSSCENSYNQDKYKKRKQNKK